MTLCKTLRESSPKARTSFRPRGVSVVITLNVLLLYQCSFQQNNKKPEKQLDMSQINTLNK